MYDCKSGGSRLKSYHLGSKLSPQKYFHFYKLESQNRVWLSGENTHSQCFCFLLCGGPSIRKLLDRIFRITQCLLWLVHSRKVWAPFSACHFGCICLAAFHLTPLSLRQFRTWVSTRNIFILIYNEICFIDKIFENTFLLTIMAQMH